MPIYKGSAKLGTVYHGSAKIEKGYKGSTLVYSGQLSMYNLYVGGVDLGNGFYDFYLGEPDSNKIVLGGAFQGSVSFIATSVLASLQSITGTPGTTGSSLYISVSGSNNGPFNYSNNFIDSYGSLWYRYQKTDFFTMNVFMSPFNTTVGSNVVNTGVYDNALFSQDASTVYIRTGNTVMYTTSSAGTLAGTFQYK